jgi:hypothetical protein
MRLTCRWHRCTVHLEGVAGCQNMIPPGIKSVTELCYSRPRAKCILQDRITCAFCKATAATDSLQTLPSGGCFQGVCCMAIGAGMCAQLLTQQHAD